MHLLFFLLDQWLEEGLDESKYKIRDFLLIVANGPHEFTRQYKGPTKGTPKPFDYLTLGLVQLSPMLCYSLFRFEVTCKVLGETKIPSKAKQGKAQNHVLKSGHHTLARKMVEDLELEPIHHPIDGC
jgi:hypothetical protein